LKAGYPPHWAKLPFCISRFKDNYEHNQRGCQYHLGSQPQFAEWQVKKAWHTLRLIYEAFLPLYAPETSHGGQVSKRVQQAATLFRDQVIPGDARAFQGMEGKMAESTPEGGRASG
jgi:hypothetical protein